MTVIQPNSISGINSITVASGEALSIHAASGDLVTTLTSTSGIATYKGIHVGSGTTTSNQGVSVGTGCSIVSDAVNQLSVYTNNTERIQVRSDGKSVISETGTLTPLSLLTLRGTAGVEITLVGASANDQGVYFNDGSNSGGVIYDHNTDKMSFRINANKNVTINSLGSLSVGTGGTVFQNGNIAAAGIVTANGGFVVGAAATIYSNGNATFSGISTFVRASLTGSSESAITTQAATSGGTTTLDMNTSDNWIITMGGNTTMGGTNNIKLGQTGSLWMVQDGTGSRTAAWNSAWKWVGGTAPTLSTAANSIDRIDYVAKSGSEIHAVASLDVK